MNKKQTIKLNESQLKKIIKESVVNILNKQRRLLREFGYDNRRDDLVGIELGDAIEQAESEGWKWNPRDERRDGDILQTILRPNGSMDTGRYSSVCLYLTSRADDESNSFRVESACETWN